MTVRLDDARIVKSLQQLESVVSITSNDLVMVWVARLGKPGGLMPLPRVPRLDGDVRLFGGPGTFMGTSSN